MKKIKIALVLGCLVVMVMATLALTTGKEKNTIAYIHNQEVYAEFGLTKDLQNEYNKTFNQRKAILDSMEARISGLAKKVELENGRNKEDLDRVTVLQEEFVVRKRQLEQENQVLNQKYQAQILDQMNEYLEMFGQEKELKLLFGANGNGEIMYADPSVDMTKEAIVYINHQYAGKK